MGNVKIKERPLRAARRTRGAESESDVMRTCSSVSSISPSRSPHRCATNSARKDAATSRWRSWRLFSAYSGANESITGFHWHGLVNLSSVGRKQLRKRRIT